MADVGKWLVNVGDKPVRSLPERTYRKFSLLYPKIVVAGGSFMDVRRRYGR